MSFDWESLKKFSGSRFAQYALLVPIIGWLLVYQNTFLETLSTIFEVQALAQTSWELLVFYLGLVFLGIAAALFRTFAPREIVDHDGLQGYVEDTLNILTRFRFHRFCESLEVDPPKEVTVPSAGTGQVLDTTLDQWKTLNSEAITDVLTEHYERTNSARPWARRFTGFFFVAGAILTLFPTVRTVGWALVQISELIK